MSAVGNKIMVRERPGRLAGDDMMMMMMMMMMCQGVPCSPIRTAAAHGPRRGAPPAELVRDALEGGGTDNVTVVVRRAVAKEG